MTVRPFPFAPLAEALAIPIDDTHQLALVLGVHRSNVNRYRLAGLTERQADEWAVRAGLNPLDVWPDYYDRALLRGAAAINAGKTTCPRGHDYDLVDNRGKRVCGQCRNPRNSREMPGRGRRHGDGTLWPMSAQSDPERVRVSVYVPPGLAREIEQLARERDISVSAAARELFRRALAIRSDGEAA